MTRAEIIATVDQHMDAAMLKVHADLLAAVASGDFDLEAVIEAIDGSREHALDPRRKVIDQIDRFLNKHA